MEELEDEEGGVARDGPMRAALEMLKSGVALSEPFLSGILHSLRNSLLRDVLERARIPLTVAPCLPNGQRSNTVRLAALPPLCCACRDASQCASTLMGVMDEEGVLEYGECVVCISPPWAPTLASRESIENADVVVYRSPGMHPSDVRIPVSYTHLTLPTICSV